MWSTPFNQQPHAGTTSIVLTTCWLDNGTGVFTFPQSNINCILTLQVTQNYLIFFLLIGDAV